ncbi:MAG: 3'(2'),5'-bisphosphate nucleotidase CysQ [Gammaproteobacteria bacterium]|nr:3'(2'),5'-bisphosphate nucleotidase CysQ [Gammaproteobacteria bacterium]
MAIVADEALLQQVVAIARRAAQRIMEVYARDFDVNHKADRSPLTEADLAAHQEIVDGLQSLTPQTPVLSEESSHVDYQQRRHWQQYWLVDPLDGTREFIKRNGEFTVNIALIDCQQPVLGVVVVPVTGQCYSALRGHGAFCDGPDGVRRLQVRAFNPADVVIAGSRSHGGARLSHFLDRIGPHRLVSIGSSLKSCLVAEGVADIYPRLGPTSEWDTAAAQCVVEAAGGILTDIHLQPLRYNTKESLLNPEFLVIGDPRHDWRRYLPQE